MGGEGGGDEAFQPERYQHALLELAVLDKWNYGEALRRILRVDAEALGVERVNFWLLERAPEGLRCEEGYQRSAGRYEAGAAILRADCPRYFTAVELDQVIQVEDAHLDARTAELAGGYLRPHGIGALLDVPVWCKGRLAGVLCHEHVGPKRRWSEPETALAMAMAQAVATTLEVRERRRAEEALRASEEEKLRLVVREQAAREQLRARDEFLSVASHELYTPLTSLQLSVQRLRKTEPADSDAARSLALVERQVQRLTQLVSSLLDVARIQSGRLTMTPQEMDLAELARDVTERFGETARRARCALTLVAPRPVRGVWDRSHLDQVLTNLLSNAVKFSPGKPVEVAVTAEAGQARLVVRDRGIGVPADRLPDIFERFTRAAPARTYGGLGLGLHISRGIVEAHGGTIGIASTLGQGTTVTVTLPLRR